MKRVLVVFAVVVLVAAVGSVGAAGGSAAEPGSATLTVTGTGKARFTSDVANVSFGVESTAVTAAGAVSANAAVMRTVIAALERDGVEKLATGSLRISPRRNADGSRILDYTVDNAAFGSIRVEKVGDVIGDAFRAGATSVDGPTFTTSEDSEALYRTALRAATVQARERAKVLAEAAGVRLGRLVSIEPTYDQGVAVTAGTSSSSTPVIAPAQALSASVKLVFALE